MSSKILRGLAKAAGAAAAVYFGAAMERRRALSASVSDQYDLRFRIESLRAQLEEHEKLMSLSENRLAVLEATLIEQAKVTQAIGERVLESDHRQRTLLSAVEALCDRVEPSPPPSGALDPNSSELSFESHLNAVLRRSRTG